MYLIYLIRDGISRNKFCFRISTVKESSHQSDRSECWNWFIFWSLEKRMAEGNSWKGTSIFSIFIYSIELSRRVTGDISPQPHIASFGSNAWRNQLTEIRILQFALKSTWLNLITLFRFMVKFPHFNVFYLITSELFTIKSILSVMINIEKSNDLLSSTYRRYQIQTFSLSM